MKKKISIFLVLSIIFSSTFAVEFSFRANPTLVMPQKEYFKTSFGAELQADVCLFNCITAGLEGAYFNMAQEQMSSSMNLFNGGLGLGAYYNLFSRLYVAGGGSFGLYKWFQTDDSLKYDGSNMYWRAYGELGFRITPAVTVTANGGYVSYISNNEDRVFISGPFAGIGLKYNFVTGKKGSGASSINLQQDGIVYPLFQQMYRISPIGTVKITNGESSEIRNVTVSFRAGKYTSSAYHGEKINTMRRMETRELPLYVDFSSDLLKFSEDGKLSGEVVMEYELLGKKKYAVQTVALSVGNRNSYEWGNNESLAAFISGNTPEVLEYAKYVAGVARNDFYSGMNRNIQFAAAMLEALRSSGIKYSNDKTTPYAEYHTGRKKDFIQYPLQTMNYVGGDYDDIGILFASCLESVGVETAVMPVDNDFIVLVGLGVKASQAENHFADVETLIIDEDNVYFPLSMANLEKGFVKSRTEGGKIIKQANTDENCSFEFIPVHAAWEIYPPAVYTGLGSSLATPSTSSIEKNMIAAIKDYIATDLEGVIRNARASGNPNKLGMAYVRAGRFAEAKAEFNKAAANGSVAAMNNIANIMMLEKDYAGAAAQYKKVLQKDPQNSTAKNGLENANSKL